jgi:glutamate/aspartate transport system substrate-binding protein
MTLAYREAVDPVLLPRRQGQADRLRLRDLREDRRPVKAATGRADLQKQYQAVTSANRIPLLQNGTIDIECGSTDQQLRARQAGRVRDQLLLHRHALPGEGRARR